MRPYLVAIAAVSLVCLACQPEDPFPTSAELEQIRLLGVENAVMLKDTTNRFADTPAAAALGESLFYDQGVSGCGTVACASCHVSTAGYAGTTPLGDGCFGGKTGRNVPTVLNVGYRKWMFWDGRQDSPWAQATGPLTAPNEMAATPDHVRSYLQQNYAPAYHDLFGVDPVNEADDERLVSNFGKVIEAYERTLTKIAAPFDDQLHHFEDTVDSGGDATKDPLYFELKTFVRTGQCIQCHLGPTFTDEDFHNIGVSDASKDQGRAAGIAKIFDASNDTFIDTYYGAGAYSDDTATQSNWNIKLKDLANQVSDPTLVGAMKTPSLRNVALTAPYFHNGSLASLSQVVDFYNRGGDDPSTFAGSKPEKGTIRPLHLSTAERQALIDLLNSLTAK